MSHCRTPSLHNHLDHCFVVFKHTEQSFLMRRLHVLRERWSSLQRVAPFDQESDLRFQGQKQSEPTNRERESRPISIRRPKRWFRILFYCAKLNFVSYTMNLLEQMYDFQKRTMFLRKWILSPPDLLQSRNLETVPVCIVWQYFPHDNTVCIYMCDECMKSIDSGVCQKLWSIL